MNVLKALMAVILRQLVTTLKEVSPVLVTLDSQTMGHLAHVNASINLFLKYQQPLHICFKASEIQVR